MYKSERLELRLTAREVQILDHVRGAVTRSAWIRQQIQQAGVVEIVSTNVPTVTDHADGTYPGEPRMVDQHIVESPLTEEND